MTDTPLQLRSFIAIPLPRKRQQQIAELQRQLRQQLPELKTPKAETLHLTLHFLGEQTEEQLAKISKIMLSIGQKKKNFNVSLQGLDLFPHRRQPKVLWLGIKPEDELTDLYLKLSAALDKLGLRIDHRPYRPHITIGRFKQVPRKIERLCPFLSHCCGSLNIDRMVLYSSKLTAQGAIHTPLKLAPLKVTTH